MTKVAPRLWIAVEVVPFISSKAMSNSAKGYVLYEVRVAAHGQQHFLAATVADRRANLSSEPAT